VAVLDESVQLAQQRQLGRIADLRALAGLPD